MADKLTDSQELAKNIRIFIGARRDGKEVSLLKAKPNKKGKGGINTKLIVIAENVAKGDNTIKEKLSDIKKEKKSREISSLAFEQAKYNKLLDLTAGMAQSVIDEYQESLEKINNEHDIAIWLSWAADKAEGRSLATHIIKLTNSSISKASNIYDKTSSTDLRYLTTSSLASPNVDGTGNAAFAPITSLLEIRHEGKMLADYIIENDGSPLAEFSDDSQQVDSWVKGLKRAIDSSKKSSHNLAKQVYFPIDDNKYHLLLPLVSSTMAHALFEKFSNASYKNQKKAIDKKNKNLYDKKTIISYPNKAVIKVTASNHQNASSLNGKRGGRLSLLSCRPPVWKSRPNPPLKIESLFHGEVRFLTRKAIIELRKFLLLIKKKELNPKDIKLHNYFLGLMDSIIDSLFDYVSTIQQLLNKAGWSAQSKLKLSHKLWLDPQRDDEFFQQQRNTIDWQEEICADFASWLNDQLSYKKKLTLSLAQEVYWGKVMKHRLREFEAIREVQA